MTLRLNGTTSGYVEIDSAATSSNHTIVLPSSNGTANQFLKNGTTAGTLGWSSLVEDASGRLLVGTSSTSANTVAMLTVQGYVGDANGLGLVALRTGSSSPNNNVSLGRIDFNDSTDSRGASIDVQRDGGTWSASSKPSKLILMTTADGASSPTERMRIRANGDVVTTTSFNTSFNGISTGAFAYDAQTGLPAAGLTVIINRGNDGAGTAGVSLSRSATAWSAYSDERAKTGLVPIDDGLSKVSTLRSVTGRYLDDEPGTSRSFLIAQDVQAVLPEAVDAGDPDKLNLRYTEVIPLLVAALKEAKERIETLETANAALETRLAALEAQQ